jgi:hypothetical protein
LLLTNRTVNYKAARVKSNARPQPNARVDGRRADLPRTGQNGAGEGERPDDALHGGILPFTGRAGCCSGRIPQANTVTLLPTEIGGQKVEWIVLDDATDTTKG